MNRSYLWWVLAFGLALNSASAAPDTSRVATPAINWRACADFPGVDCATVRVPLDYDQPEGATTKLALARIRASDPAHRIGTVFLNPGGPGGSGVELVVDGWGEYLEQSLKGRFDIVGFDPRGVAASEPLHCFKNEAAFEKFYNATPYYFPYKRRLEPAFFDLLSSLAETCFARKQRIIDHMSTADVVRDLDLLRRAVGDQRLNFIGYSYGSYIGNTYANMFPHKVRALVIDGVLDPRLWSRGTHIKLDRVATAEEFEQFLRLCDEAPEGCALSNPSGAAQRYWKIARALRQHPIDDPSGFYYAFDYLVADSADAMYAPEYWPDYAAFFEFLHETLSGDPAAATKALALRESIRARLKPRQQNYPNDYDAYYGNQCADSEFPRTLKGFSDVSDYAEEGSIFGPYWWWQNSPCARWPVSKDRYAGPWNAETSAPVLIVGNYYDGITAYAGAVASSRLLKNSRLLTYAGWGHTAGGRSACVDAYVSQYVLRGKLPKEGTVCPANPNPFAVAVTARAAVRAPLVGLPPPWR